MDLLPLSLRFLLHPQITAHVSGISLKPKTIKFEITKVILAIKF